MIKDALDYLYKRFMVDRFEVDGYTYFAVGGGLVPCPHPVAPKLADPIRLKTLSGFTQFVWGNVDALSLSSTVVVVEPSTVYLAGCLNTHREREIVVRADFCPARNDFASPRSVGDFLLMLAESFQPLGDFDKVARLFATVNVTDAKKQVRDGLNFRIAAERDLAGDGWADVDGFVTLHPFRVFPEAGDQPPVRFNLAVDVSESGSVSVRLIQADGRSWEQPAAEMVAHEVIHLFEGLAEGAAYPEVVA